MSQALLVITTAPTGEDAQRIARALVEQRLAGCVQVGGPVTSTYWWEDQIEESREWVCAIKTDERYYPAAEQAIRATHPYDVPEIIAMPIVAGSRDYLDWLSAQLTPSR